MFCDQLTPISELAAARVGKTLYALDAFHVENGEITEQQNLAFFLLLDNVSQACNKKNVHCACLPSWIESE